MDAMERAARKLVDSVEVGNTLTVTCGNKSVKIEGRKGGNKVTTTGGNEMAGQQMVMDPATGELVDEDVIRQLYTDTAIAGKALLTERCKLGEFVKISVIAQVVKVGEAMDGKGAKSHFQTIAITQVEDVKRGAI